MEEVDSAPYSGRLVLIGGPAGAGKTTLARAWCATRERSVHIELDSIRDLIVSGRADPQIASPLASEQYAVSVEACVRLAVVYLDAGYDVAIDDVLEPGTFEAYWAPPLSGLSYTLLVLMPELDEVLQRVSEREKRVNEGVIRAQYAACEGWPAGRTLDTTGLTPNETLGFALAERLLP